MVIGKNVVYIHTHICTGTKVSVRKTSQKTIPLREGNTKMPSFSVPLSVWLSSSGLLMLNARASLGSEPFTVLKRPSSDFPSGLLLAVKRRFVVRGVVGQLCTLTLPSMSRSSSSLGRSFPPHLWFWQDLAHGRFLE